MRGDEKMKLGKMEKRAMISQKHAKYGIEHVERLLRYVNLKENQNYLEVGCGNGHVCKHLAMKRAPFPFSTVPNTPEGARIYEVMVKF